MTAYTSPVGLPYPTATERVRDGHAAIAALANATDDAIVADRAAIAAGDAALDARLDVVEGRLADTGWIGLSLQNGWQHYVGFAYPAIRKIAGIVYWKGLVRLGTPFTVITVAPAGFRPAEQRLFAAVMNLSGLSTHGGGGYVDVPEVAARVNLTAGGVLSVSNGTQGSNAYVSLDSITPYPAEA